MFMREIATSRYNEREKGKHKARALLRDHTRKYITSGKKNEGHIMDMKYLGHLRGIFSSKSQLQVVFLKFVSEIKLPYEKFYPPSPFQAEEKLGNHPKEKGVL